MGHCYKFCSTCMASIKTTFEINVTFSHGCSSEKENLGLSIQAAFSPGAGDTVDSTSYAFWFLKVRLKHLILLPNAYS